MRRLQFLLVIVVLLLAACTDSASSNTSLATAPELSQVYGGSMADGAEVSIHYPEDWGIQATLPDFGIALTFPADLAQRIGNSSEASFESGQVQVFVIFSPKTELAAILENSSAVGLLESFLANVDSSVGNVGEVESKTLDGREAASVLLSESSGDSYAVVIDAGDAYVVVTGTFASGDLAQHQATIEAIAISTNYTAFDEEASAEATESS